MLARPQTYSFWVDGCLWKFGDSLGGAFPDRTSTPDTQAPSGRKYPSPHSHVKSSSFVVSNTSGIGQNGLSAVMMHGILGSDLLSIDKIF